MSQLLGCAHPNPFDVEAMANHPAPGHCSYRGPIEGLSTNAPRPQSLLKRIRYIGPLEPAAIASWLRDDVGLTTYDVVAQFYWNIESTVWVTQWLEHPS